MKPELKKGVSPETKKYIIAGVIALISIAGAAIYLQYKKIMDYTLKLKRMRINKVTKDLIDVDLFLLLENKSSVDYTIKSQEYMVYVNNIFVSKLENNLPNLVKAKSVSEIGVNVKMNPTELAAKVGASVLGTIFDPEKTIIKIDMKLKISFYGITITIPYTHLTNLKELTTPPATE